MILEWHLLFKIITRIFKEMFEICGKPSKFLTKNCLFIFCIFCLIEEELIHLLHLGNMSEMNFFYSASQRIKQREQKYNSAS